MTNEEIHAHCEGCSKFLPESQLKVIPKWHQAYNCFLTNHFCSQCFPAAFNELSKHSSDDAKWKKLIQYCELHQMHDLADELRKVFC